MEAVYLHGCVKHGCDKVWRETDAENVCPKCGTQRFNAGGKAREFVIWYPLAKRFESLFKCEQYCQAVRHECRRPQAADPDYITDVYDSPWWNELMGRVTGRKITRMGLLLCLDGFPACFPRWH